MVPANDVRKFRVSVVEWLLKNEFYYGRFEWDGVMYEGKHDLIIPQAHLAAVRESFSRAGRRSALAAGEAPFAGWLRCAHPECGMLVTFEKKEKTVKETGEAKVYRFYRCSNSRKVHASLAGMYTSEERIWEQFEPVIEQMDLPEQLAKDIADALNETNKKAQAKTRREIQAYQEAIVATRHHEDEAYAHFRKGVLDERGYRRQIDMLRAEQDRLTKLLEQAQLAITDACMRTAKEIFELATNALSLWKKRTREERLEVLRRVCSNAVLDGQTLRYDLKKPFVVLSEMKHSENWSG